MQRIGVFVCHCGTNIAATVDVKAVAEALGKEPGVVVSTEYQYMCSQAGQNMIIDAVKEHKLIGQVFDTYWIVEYSYFEVMTPVTNICFIRYNFQ